MFSPPAVRIALLSLILLGLPAHAGLTQYADRGRVDFDNFVQLLNPYGTWSRVGDLWAYTPLDHQAPYTDGRWLYTEYGWYWKGNRPHSWATEHYGYWKRGADRVWAWFPGPYWLAETVEFRATPTHIGWRSAAVDDDGNFIEAPADRYEKTDEWTFVSKAQFAGPITPNIIASPDQAAKLLDLSTDCMHSYLTYRAITRPGPHPADFVGIGDGRMFAPEVIQAGLDAVKPPPPKLTPAEIAAEAKIKEANASVPKPALVSDETDDGEPPVDARQVHYWITMSLPTFWTARPAGARATEIYLYRPDLAQDQDGIERRIGLWLDPGKRTSLGLRLQDVLAQRHLGKPGANPSAVSAAAAGGDASGGAFKSPFEDGFSGKAPHSPAPSASSQAAGPAPSGAASSVPAGTNAAPAGV